MRSQTDAEAAGALVFEGFLLDVDYLASGERALIRLTVRGSDGLVREVFDPGFRPYFYFVPSKGTDMKEMMKVQATDGVSTMRAEEMVHEQRTIFGKEVDSYRVYAVSPSHVPKLSAAFARHGSCYEYDIPFAKRYLVDNAISPLTYCTFRLKRADGLLAVEEIKPLERDTHEDPPLNVLCFDIEVYNPRTITLADRDPVIMLSYAYNSNGERGDGVITYRKITDRPYVTLVEDEKALFAEFKALLDRLDIDVVTGYNSANYDVKYMLERAKTLKIEFDMDRFAGATKLERHGLVEKVKIAGRVHVDMYNVVKFIATVGAAEYILKLNSYTLKNVYEAITKKAKTNVNKAKIYEMWDGPMDQLQALADYNLSDSHALEKVYETFVPIMTALSKVTGNSLSDVCVSTTGQLVEFMLMKYAHAFGELIPNKPDDREIRARLANPIEGAYVKTPEPGIYENLVLFDFRGLYP